MKIRCIVIVIFCLFLSACTREKNTDLKHYIKQVQMREPKPIEPIPTFPKPAVVRYAAYNLRSPFIPFTQKRDDDDQDAPDRRRQKEPLEAFPLDALRMVGTLTSNNQLWALISAPDGKIYKVRVGNYLGQNYGKIQKISPGRVAVQETVKISGNWEKKPASLQIATE